MNNLIFFDHLLNTKNLLCLRYLRIKGFVLLPLLFLSVFWPLQNAYSQLLPCPPATCGEELFCYGDFNDLTPSPFHTPAYFDQLGLTYCPGINNSSENSPDVICVNPDTDNVGINLGYVFDDNYYEAIYFPLSGAVEPGNSIELNVDAIQVQGSQGSLLFFASEDDPCTLGVVPNTCTDLNGFICMGEQTPTANYFGVLLNEDCLGFFTPYPDASYQSLNINWPNNTNEVINYITVVVGNPSNHATGNLIIDNISVVEECPPPGCLCTGPNGKNIDAGIGKDLSELISQGDLSPGAFDNTGKCLAISGTLIMDEDNYLIQGGEIRMQPGAEIIVQDGKTLELLNINENGGMHGCEQMWKSITVDPGGGLVSTNCEFQDAQHAILAIGSTGVLPSLNINSCIFQNNHIGINVANGGSDFVPVTGPSVRGCTFRGVGGLLPPFDPGLLNYNSDSPFAGINLNRTALFVGAKDIAGFMNTFNNLRYGIRATASYVEVHYSFFEDIEAIGVFGHFFSELKVEDSNFNNTTIGAAGIWGAGSTTIEAFDNSTTNLATGIFNGDPNFAKTRIERCTINDCINSAIQVINPKTTIIIRKNVINRAGDITFFADEYKIGAINLNSGTKVDKGHILQNKINQETDAPGIRISNCGGFILEQNTVTYTGLSNGSGNIHGGIHLDASAHSNKLRENKITSDNEDAGVAGIYTVYSGSNNMCCNWVDGTHYGIAFSGPSDHTNLRTNRIRSHAVGLFCDEATVIGEQELVGNSWGGSYSLHGAQHLGSEQDIINSQFRVELPVVPPLWPMYDAQNESGLPGEQWFTDWPGNSNNCWAAIEGTYCPYVISEDPNIGGPVPADLGGRDIGIAKGELAGTPHADMMIFEGSRSLYRNLTEFGYLLGLDQDVDNFYAANATTNIGLLHGVESGIEALWDISAGDSSQIATYYGQLDSLSSEIALVDSLYEAAATQQEIDLLEAQRNGLVTEVALAADNLHQLFDGQATARTAAADLVLADNAAIVPANTLESNRVTVNRVFLETLAKGITVFTQSQKDDLSTVANQCPLTGGSAVHEARALYSMIEEAAYDDDALCNNSNNLVQQDDQATATENKAGSKNFGLFPNPANETVVLERLSEYQGPELVVRISSLSGVTVQKALWKSPADKLEVSLRGIPNGIYYCTIFEDGKRVGSQKLVVIK